MEKIEKARIRRRIATALNKIFLNHPHRIYHVRQIPLTETGKPARAQAQQLAKELLKESPSH